MLRYPFNALITFKKIEYLRRITRFELVTSGVTDRYSNQTELYTPLLKNFNQKNGEKPRN